MGCCGAKKVVRFIIDDKVIVKLYRKATFEKVKGDLICSYGNAKFIKIVEIDGVGYDEVIKNEG